MNARKAAVFVGMPTVALLASTSLAVTEWTHIGTSGLKVGAGYSPLWDSPAKHTQDVGRVKINSMAVDGDGNIYFTANNWNNETVPGGMSILNPHGTRPNVT